MSNQRQEIPEGYIFNDDRLKGNFSIQLSDFLMRVRTFGVDDKKLSEAFPEIFMASRPDEIVILPKENLIEKLRILGFREGDLTKYFADMVLAEEVAIEWRKLLTNDQLPKYTIVIPDPYTLKDSEPFYILYDNGLRESFDQYYIFTPERLQDTFSIKLEEFIRRIHAFGVDNKKLLEIFPEVVTTNQIEETLSLPKEDFIEKLRMLGFEELDLVHYFADVILDEAATAKWRKNLEKYLNR